MKALWDAEGFLEERLELCCDELATDLDGEGDGDFALGTKSSTTKSMASSKYFFNSFSLISSELARRCFTAIFLQRLNTFANSPSFSALSGLAGTSGFVAERPCGSVTLRSA